MTTPTTNRRALLAGIAAAPAVLALGTAPATASPDKDAFTAALADFNAKNARFLRICANPSGCTDDEAGDACGIAGDAYDVLIATAAPDFAGVSAKLHAMMVWCEGSVIPNEEVARIAADARRLASGGA